MKIPASTSFVMAATASLALQSSALAMPHPESPDLSGFSPRSGRTQFSGSGPTVRSSREPSQARRGIAMREAQADSSSSLNALLGDVTETVVETLDGLGIKREEGGKDVGDSFRKLDDPSLARRQAPVAPPGVPGPANQVVGMPAQVEGGVIQAGSSAPNSIVGGTIQQIAPQPLPSAPIPAPLPPSGVPFLNGAPQPPTLPFAPPQPMSNIVPRGADTTDANPIGIAQQVPGTVIQAAGGLIGNTPVGGVANVPLQAVGNAGQTIAGTPAGGAVGAVGGITQNLPNPIGSVEGIVSGVPVVGGTVSGTIQGAANTANQIVGSIPVAQDIGVPFAAQAEPNGDSDVQDGEDGPASPSSTAAVPSSSPSSSPTSATDEVTASSSDATSATDAPMSMMKRQVSIPAPLPISLPTNVPFSIVSGVLSDVPMPSLPVSVPIPTSSLPVPLPILNADGAPAHKDPALPISLLNPLASPPISLPVNPLASPPVSLPVSPLVPLPSGVASNLPIQPLVSALPVDPLSLAPLKRDVGIDARAPPEEVESVIRKLMQDGTPPLFIPTASAAKVAVGPEASASLGVSFSSAPSPTDTDGPSAPTVSQPATATLSAPATMSTQPSRRRFFRFFREKF